METALIILNITIMLLLVFGLFHMQKRHLSFSKRVFTALGLGIVFGFILQFIYGPTSEVVTKSAEWFNLIGGGYVKFLQMIVMPLVFISILGAFTKLTLTNNIGKISGLIIGILVGTAAVAAGIGIATAVGFDLEAVQIEQGNAEAERSAELEETYGTIEEKGLPQQILDLL
ncbi:MAG TPA: cation:dicarboxylase symporter family transporter, partial [Chondromyces sp.]|nr:cation:dicarboxylase symporter family transporter [Chondromyces sp.]